MFFTSPPTIPPPHLDGYIVYYLKKLLMTFYFDSYGTTDPKPKILSLSKQEIEFDIMVEMYAYDTCNCGQKRKNF